MPRIKIRWPEGKSFAFTIVDDTDRSTLDRIKPVYDFLRENDFRTTKTVWPLKALGEPITGGDTLEDEEYRKWVMELRSQGFEIALHGIADETSPRQRVERGLALYRQWLGEDSRMHVNHVGQQDAVYWGAARFDGPLRWMYWLYRKYRRSDVSSFGHRPGDDRFWGDLCLRQIRYVRNFVFPDILTTAADPFMPYHDPARPYVKYWYSASYGSGIENFLRLISESNQDRLASEGGACIVYTHLGSTFYPLHPEFRRLMTRMSRLPGWFVPASTLLDHLGEQRRWQDVSRRRLSFASMQYRWAFQQYQRARAARRGR
ncbi:MAG: hypothetical protein ABI592_00330 [Acidobacteriota bacterium]